MGPAPLGSGEHLFAGLDMKVLGYECSEHVTTPSATHFVLTKRVAAEIRGLSPRWAPALAHR